VGTDITIELPPGDPERGLDLADRLVDGYCCTDCHVSSRPPAPNFAASDELPAIGERGAIRIAAADYTGAATTPEQYLFESIVLPDAYQVEGRWADYAEMDEDFGERLSQQDVADLIAWLLTLK
jgi:hypothetical protein